MTAAWTSSSAATCPLAVLPGTCLDDATAARAARADPDGPASS
jgi:hypothetical protein